MKGWTLTDFVRESNRIEGIHRKPTEAEVEATAAFVRLDKLTVQDVCRLVSVFAPGHRLRDQPGLNVRVGNHIAPLGGPAVGYALAELLGRINTALWSKCTKGYADVLV